MIGLVIAIIIFVVMVYLEIWNMIPEDIRFIVGIGLIIISLSSIGFRLIINGDEKDE